MKNILILGACGFLGRNLVDTFVNNGCNVHVLDKFDTHFFFKNKNITHVELSIMQTDGLVEFIDNANIDVVIHLISSMIPSSSSDDLKTEIDNVLVPSFQLLERIKDRNIKFIYFSSGGTIYGNNGHIDLYSESIYPKPITYYGLSKQFFESYIECLAAKHDVDYLILRPSNPYGRYQNANGKQGFIAAALGRIFSNKSIDIWGDGSSIRDYIYIDDLCNIVLKLIEADVTKQTLNIGSGVGSSLLDIVNILRDLKITSDLSVNFLPSRSVDVDRITLDTSLIKSFISYEITPLNIGIELFIKQLKEYTNV